MKLWAVLIYRIQGDIIYRVQGVLIYMTGYN